MIVVTDASEKNRLHGAIVACAAVASELPATLHVGRTSHPARLVGRDGKATLEVDHEVAGRGDVRVTVHGKIGSPLFRLGRLPRLAAALRLDRARGVAGRLARRLAPRLAPRLARRLRG